MRIDREIGGDLRHHRIGHAREQRRREGRGRDNDKDRVHTA